MQRKSTLATFRDLPNYPQIVARGVAAIHLFMGLTSLLPGLALLSLLTNNPDLIKVFGRFLQVDGTGLMGSLAINGSLAVFFGAASLWVAFGNLTVRPSIWVTTIWVTALYVFGLLLGASNAGVFQYLLMILAAAAVVLYLFDNRIKAVFGRGKLAEQYAEWRSERYLGRTTVATPWEYEVKPKKPLLGDKDKPL